MRIKALSLWEPWATLMRLGAKTIETRSWPTSHRGPLLICAAKRRNLGELRQIFSDPAYRRPLGITDAAPLGEGLDRLHFGQAVAIVDVVGCIRTLALIFDPRCAAERPYGNYSPTNWGWMTSNLRRIPPFPVRGRQGLFEVDLPPGLEP